MTLHLNEDIENGVTILHVAGRLDSNNAAGLEEKLFERARVSPVLLLDMKAVPYVSSAGLRVLLGAAKIARATGNRLALCDLSLQVREVLDLSGFAHALEIFGTRADVVRTLGAS